MSVIVCRKERAEHPYFIEHLGVSVYTSQELCYAIYHHPILAMDGFIGRNFIDFIRDELNMGFAAMKMERWMKSGENQDELIFLFLQEAEYYSGSEINRLRQRVTALRKMPPLEYAKAKADYLMKFKQYGRAIAGYEKILESPLSGRADDAFLGKVWNNLGACYARVFQFDRAVDAYDRAYGKLKDVNLLKRIYHLTKLKPDIPLKERYQSIVTDEMREAWDREFEQAEEHAAQSGDIEKLNELFKKDPVKRMEGARQLLESWKQEYRGMA